MKKIKKITIGKVNIFSLIKYLFVFIFCLLIVELCACESALKKAEDIAENIPFNYPGLRIETRAIKKDSLKNKDPIIVCFGDSITFGWNLPFKESYPFLLEKDLERELAALKVINSGIGGDTTADGLSRIKRDVLSYKPNLVIINFGLNDAMLDKSSSTLPEEYNNYFKADSSYFLPALSLSSYDNNYREIIDILDKEEIEVVIMGLNYVTDDFPPGEEDDFKEKQKEIFTVYNRRIPEIADDAGKDFIDLWSLFESNDEGPVSLIQPDGLHPNSRGQELIKDSVYDYILNKGLF